MLACAHYVLSSKFLSDVDPLHFLFSPFLFQGNLEGAQEGQVNSTSMSHYKEIQRKIVEFLRKRYHLLERALNLEYAVVQY
jgi:hypothetical protein